MALAMGRAMAVYAAVPMRVVPAPKRGPNNNWCEAHNNIWSNLVTVP